MNNPADTGPFSFWSDNSVTSGASGTVAPLSSRRQHVLSHQTAIERWEGEGGRVPPYSRAADIPG